MPPCSPGDSYSMLTIGLIILLCCSAVGALFRSEHAWRASAGAAQKALAVVAGLAVLAFVLGDVVGPLVDQVQLRWAGREAQAELLEQRRVERRRGYDLLVDYRFAAILPDGTRCAVLRQGEELLQFDQTSRQRGDLIAVRYLPDQPQIARLVAPAAAFWRQVALALVFVVILPALLAVRKLWRGMRLASSAPS